MPVILLYDLYSRADTRSSARNYSFFFSFFFLLPCSWLCLTLLLFKLLNWLYEFTTENSVINTLFIKIKEIRVRFFSFEIDIVVSRFSVFNNWCDRYKGYVMVHTNGKTGLTVVIYNSIFKKENMKNYHFILCSHKTLMNY